MNIHFARVTEESRGQLAESGFKWIRKDLYWKEVEKRPGEFDFSRYDNLMSVLTSQGKRAILILDYGNPLYQEGPPRSEKARAAFLRYVRTAVTRYKGRGVLWEIWNEPHLAQFWPPKPDPTEYVAFARQVAQTIRSVSPDEWVVGPATSGTDFSFLERAFDKGLASFLDAVTVHPYRKGPPEEALGDWSRLRKLIDRYRPGLPMLSGEWGYSEIVPGMNARLQSAYAPRQYLVNLMAGVPITIWYDWRNGPNAGDKEHRFGLIEERGQPKNAFRQVQHLATALNGYRYSGWARLPRSTDYLLKFVKGSSVRYVAWTTGEEHQVDLPISAASFTFSRVGAKASGGKRFTIRQEPVVVVPQG